MKSENWEAGLVGIGLPVCQNPVNMTIHKSNET